MIRSVWSSVAADPRAGPGVSSKKGRAHMLYSGKAAVGDEGIRASFGFGRLNMAGRAGGQISGLGLLVAGPSRPQHLKP